MTMFLHQASVAKARCFMPTLLMMMVGLWLTACSPNKNNAQACFNPAFFKEGNSIRTNHYTVINNDNDNPSLSEETLVVQGPTQYHGYNSAWRLHTVNNNDNGKVSKMLSDSYFRVVPEQKIVQMVGNEYAHEGKRFGIYYSQEVPRSFDMEPGEKQHYQQTGMVIDNGQVDEQSSLNIDITRTYVGMEEVEVNAGKFTACHFTEHWQAIGDNDEFNPQQTHSDMWVARGLGVVLKSSSTTEFKVGDHARKYSTDSDLMSADINGHHYPEKK